ncbi:glycoside hydrolase family 13 protein [Cellulomonas sp. McL0617]|uniref:glycoside hydrolase family 13 protein n=1 Tax=Cellulomonas sp. McL0617 TaxID=3415675 RepID=UPI003CEA1213
MHADWWRDAVVYQVYPRSFADADGDGTGDLPGVLEHLDHLVDLGVDTVWLSPFYPSPGVDAGYDVSDYRDVDPVFGTLADLDALLSRAHAAGLRVLVDLVPNHTSSAHPWFVEALASEPGSAARARYVFATGTADRPPNDWESNFGGPAWERVPETDQWYLHVFAAGQPDLNWRNPEVRAEFEDVLRFWLDRGVDGFRVDVAHGLMKAEGLPDRGGTFIGAVEAGGDAGPMWDQDEVHDIYREWHALLAAYEPPRILVAEAWTRPERLHHYIRSDEMQQAFNFAYLAAGWGARRFADVITSSVEMASSVGAVATWVISNHDVVRPVSRLGRPDSNVWPNGIGPDHPSPDHGLGLERARALALLTLALPGSAYVYQGEELGLPDHVRIPPESRRDPMFVRTGGAMVGRDGARVPLPWRHDAPGYGFGSPGHEPWLPQPAEYAALAVDVQAADPHSTLALYRHLIALRREHGLGRAQLLDARADEDGVLRVRTSAVEIVVTMGAAPARVDGTVIAASAPDAVSGGLLRPDAAVWLLS